MKGGKEAFLCILLLLAASTFVGGSEDEPSLPADRASSPAQPGAAEPQPTHQAKARKPRSPTFIIEEILSNHSHIRSELKGIYPFAPGYKLFLQAGVGRNNGGGESLSPPLILSGAGAMSD